MSAFILSDIFFLIGIGCFFSLAWEFLSARGAFHGISYAVRVCFLKEKRKYGEYLSAKKSKTRKSFSWKLLPLGGGCLLLSSVLFSLAV